MNLTDCTFALRGPDDLLLQGFGEPLGTPSQNRGTGRATGNAGVSGAAPCRRWQESEGERNPVMIAAIQVCDAWY